MRREDPEGTKFIKKYDISSLKELSIDGERCDMHTSRWVQSLMAKDCLVDDNYWQTETGWPIACNFRDLCTFLLKEGPAKLFLDA